jgi:hypothetical protein
MPEREPDQAPVDEMVESEPLGDDGERVDPAAAGSEPPDPHAPPSDSAPGSAGLADSPEPGQGQFQEAYENAEPEVAGVGSIKHEDEPEPARRDEPPTS